MNWRTRKTQLGWGLQLSVLCLMLSTPFWFREDLPVLEPVLKSFSKSDADESTLHASQVLVLDFQKLDSDSVMTVSSRQLRLSFPAQVLSQLEKGDAYARMPASLKSRHRDVKETWQIDKVERVSKRSPASEGTEWIKIHAPDEENQVSEYFEMSDEPCELILHFVSSSHKRLKKKVSLRYKSGGA